MRRRRREGRGKESKREECLLYFLFFFFLLKYVGKFFLNTRKAGNSSVPTSFSREMKLPWLDKGNNQAENWTVLLQVNVNSSTQFPVLFFTFFLSFSPALFLFFQ